MVQAVVEVARVGLGADEVEWPTFAIDDASPDPAIGAWFQALDAQIELTRKTERAADGRDDLVAGLLGPGKRLSEFRLRLPVRGGVAPTQRRLTLVVRELGVGKRLGELRLGGLRGIPRGARSLRLRLEASR